MGSDLSPEFLKTGMIEGNLRQDGKQDSVTQLSCRKFRRTLLKNDNRNSIRTSSLRMWPSNHSGNFFRSNRRGIKTWVSPWWKVRQKMSRIIKSWIIAKQLCKKFSFIFRRCNVRTAGPWNKQSGKTAKRGIPQSQYVYTAIAGFLDYNFMFTLCYTARKTTSRSSIMAI